MLRNVTVVFETRLFKLHTHQQQKITSERLSVKSAGIDGATSLYQAKNIHAPLRRYITR